MSVAVVRTASGYPAWHSSGHVRSTLNMDVSVITPIASSCSLIGLKLRAISLNGYKEIARADGLRSTVFDTVGRDEARDRRTEKSPENAIVCC